MRTAWWKRLLVGWHVGGRVWKDPEDTISGIIDEQMNSSS